MHRTLLAATMLGLAGVATAQVTGAPHLLRDINTADPEDQRPWSDGFVVLGGTVYFDATDAQHGTEIWATDGTPGGTRLLTDFNPGPDGGAVVGPGLCATLGGRLYFQCTQSWDDGELCSTDGTAAGTSFVTTVPGPWGLYPYNFASTGSLVFFVGDDPVAGGELWRSDGTAAGTFQLSSLVPGPGDAQVENITPLGTLALFTANEPTMGDELYVSDGTVAGTQLLLDIEPGPGSSSPQSFHVLGGVAYFEATSIGEPELWRTDGTSAGTTPVLAGATGMPVAWPTYMTDAGGVLYFLTCFGGPFAGSSPAALWRSDGTPAGTYVVKDIDATWAASNSSITAVNGRIIFGGMDATNGTEVWESDGTAAGTALLIDANPGTASSQPFGFASDGTRAWFVATTAANGAEPWVTDGTPSGTHLVADVAVGPTGSLAGVESTTPIQPALGLAFFRAKLPTSGWEPWVTDGTAAGTRMLANIQPLLTMSSPRTFENTEGACLFVAQADNSSGAGPYLTDGTGPGTVPLAAGSGAWRPFGPVALGILGHQVLMDLSTQSGDEPWVVDLDSRTAAPISPSNVRGDAISDTGVQVGAAVLCGLSDTASRWNVATWAGGVVAPVAGLQPSEMMSWGLQGNAGGRAVFWRTDASGSQLYATDGTAAGTVALQAPQPTNGFPWGTWGLQAGSLLYMGYGDASGQGLWVTDGTTAGTRALTNGPYPDWIARDAVGTPRMDAAAVGTSIVLAMSDPATGIEPWVSDGTPSGTHLLADIVPGPESSAPRWFAAIGSRVLFEAGDVAHGQELWVADLAAGTTTVLVDLVPGTLGSGPRDLVALSPQGPVIFSAWSAAGGREPWITDGTAAGTVPLPEVVPGPDSSSPSGFMPSGQHVIFAADGGTGEEPWAYDLVTAPEAGNCADGVDNDGDTAVDCADSDCASSPACLTGDSDGDGVPDLQDCAPLDPTVHHVPPEVTLLRVARTAPSTSPTLTWTDAAPAAGTGVTYEIAGDTFFALRFGAASTCLATGVGVPAWTDLGAPAERWYLVRAVDACGPPLGQRWGADSLGRPERGCP